MSVTETPAGGPQRVRELTLSMSPEDAGREHNLAGTPLMKYDNAGSLAVLSATLTGQPLEKEQCLLPANGGCPTGIQMRRIQRPR